ncbi:MULTISPECIES: glycosyltransferase family 39 protein [Thiomicrorhabdus]|uniref:Glycosyltransferase family 39 protein n=1 Tax=Thiomicrorhabdus heinhorstiae TaxID=2748010 RepID=A0ABS0BZL2_9GAMM|nr:MULTISPECIES: glycosyltransferase family 39 protein [Thiomicrorhabdus]MBF6058424.1 glycosyltransferase family 39 protein [Thiomicrorhabdus heinhorstiae]
MRPASAGIWLVSIVTFLHLILAFHTELGVDEAHYALYGLHPDWSYFDHPSLVGWLQILPMALVPTDWGARLVPILLFAIVNYLLYHLVQQLFDERNAKEDVEWIAFWSLALLNSSTLFSLMGFGLLPDLPLMIFALLLISVVHQLLQFSIGQTPLRLWVYLGILVGLAALSKYTAITLVASLILVVLFSKRWDWLKDKGLWLSILIALIFITPVLYWNWLHDWASFQYQIDHGTGKTHWLWENFARSQAIQLVSYTPLIYFIGWWMLVKPDNYRNPSSRLLVLFALPVTVLFAWGSGFEESLPHWLSLSWLLMTPLVAGTLWHNRHIRWIKYSAAGLLIIFTVLNVSLQSLLYTFWYPFEDNKNPLKTEFGWPQALQKAQQLTEQTGEERIFVGNWSYASRSAWYLRPQPIFIANKKQTQFPYWFPQAPQGSSGLLVQPSYDKEMPIGTQAYRFESCQKIDRLPLYENGRLVVSYDYYRCQGFHY